jgi:hypothetical protein
MVNPKLKNLIKKLILKEADDYLQDFTSFGGEENKRNLRNFLASKNLSNSTIDSTSLKNFPEKGNEMSLFSFNLTNLTPIQRAILKQSLNNGNIQHKVENGVVSFSMKDLDKLGDEITKLLQEEFNNAEEAYRDYFFQHGNFDPITREPIENERTKRFADKLDAELKKSRKIFNELTNIIVQEYYKYRSMDEAYVDRGGQLQDFDPFPYNINVGNEKSPLYNPSLPKRNRMKAPDGGVYLELIVTDPYQREVLEKALKIAVDKGRNMPELGGKQNLKGFKFKTMGDTLKVQFSSKYQPLIVSILEEIKKEDLGKLKQMQDDAYDMQPEEKLEQLKIFNNVFKGLINSIR